MCHSGSKHKLYYYEEGKSFRCYTECQESYDIYSLVIKAKEQQGYTLSFYEAIKYVADVTGKHYQANSTYKSSDKTDDWDWINKFKRNKVNTELKVYDDRVLDVFLPYPHESWIEEGISSESIKKYGIGFYVSQNQITIPNYNIKNELIGIRVRNLDEEQLAMGRKYVPANIGLIQYAFPTGFNLFGLNKTLPTIKKHRKIGLFESEKSVLKSDTFYGDENWTVALGGSNITRFHLDILLSIKELEEVFILPDKEFAEVGSKQEQIYAKKILKDAQMLAPYFRVHVVWDRWGKLGLKSAPIDHGKETFEFLLKNKIEITTKDEVIG
ncbi:hypothetical protein PQ478_09145 [Alkalihalophilus pseudofirmus]|uniref:hypothetical protein n=1 Tax=Alkalihalophilus pseudofirmus TaxID=79885 RepID=UPI00259B401A|nr:hypothetical protein [Alkalihalophilus pseudofirmus]WEG18635.1 hypothetical protein PQ478_09145 [Alkalihalophilus pseudofirmus]